MGPDECGTYALPPNRKRFVWGETAPPTVVNTLQAHVSYLRRVPRVALATSENKYSSKFSVAVEPSSARCGPASRLI
jgi:hypothetical protein